MASPAVTPGTSDRPLRGARRYVCGLLFLVTAINYVDRVSLGATNERVLKPALGWDDAEFAWINFSFALSYGIMFAFAGRVLDRIGVRAGLALGVLVWSLAAMGHALAGSLVALLGLALAFASRAQRPVAAS